LEDRAPLLVESTCNQVNQEGGYTGLEQWGDDELLNLLAQVDLFLPNEDEVRAISGVEDPELALRELSERARLVVVKRGPAGAMAWQDGRVWHSPGFQVEVVDTTGAGDSFNAGFLFAYVIQEQSLVEALRFANACGALSTTGYGGTAAQPTLRQVLEMLRT